MGTCGIGSETCVNGLWSGCPSPVGETCNGIDDDCNGVVDDIDGGNSVSSTRCQCYNGISPLAEACNGIDDDCDGHIDEGANCCITGQERQCGPSTEEGECVMGTSACSNGVWGACAGAVSPVDEICDDNLDNDCDGRTDQLDNDCMVPGCAEGGINQTCMCGDSARESGYCCSGIYSGSECTHNWWWWVPMDPDDSWWWILVMIGVVILIVLVALVLYLGSQGRELTWSELMKKYDT